MFIEKINISILRLPFIQSFKTSFGTINAKRTVIVKLLSSEGIIGYGEAASFDAPFYNHETTDTCFHMLKTFLAPLILKKDLQISEAASLFRRIKGNNIAKCGLEMAMWDIQAQKERLPLKTLLGGIRNRISVGESIGIKASIRDVLQEVDLRLNQGFQRIKLKIEPGWDLNVIKSVRNEFGGIPLMVDANSAYSLNDLPLFNEMDNYNLLMIEQPLDSDDLWDHAKLQKIVRTPICLDESIKNSEDARKALEMESCRIINIKIARVGGLIEAKRIHDHCARKKIPVWCGGMLETGIGRAFSIALSSLENFKYPADMSPSKFYFQEDITDTFDVGSDGYIVVGDNVGLGFKVKDEIIGKYTIHQCEIT